jgi:hypothetical protein
MLTFGAAISSATTAAEAARVATAEASAAVSAPKLAIVFASAQYDDVAEVGKAIAALLPGVPIIGGTSAACVLGPEGSARTGVSVVLLGGTGLEVVSRTVEARTPSLHEVVPIAAELAELADPAARRGYVHHSCVIFAPSLRVDGDALVAAVRKGAGARTQLAGALTGDELTMDRPRVFCGTTLCSDCIVLTSLFTKKPLVIAARHGWHAVGPRRTVTRADGQYLLELDGRRALDVWIEDVRNEGGTPPIDRHALAVYLTNEFLLGIDDEPRGTSSPTDDPMVVRAPLQITAEDAVRLTAAVGEGTHVRLVRSSPDALLRASAEAASAAVLRAGAHVAGALVLACSSRVAALGACCVDEPAGIRRRVRAPIGGACVYGEIARNIRDVDAFFNTTTVVLAFSA